MQGIHKSVIPAFVIPVLAIATLFTPLGTLLPTIQLGPGEDTNRNTLIHTARQRPARQKRGLIPAARSVDP
jgi:hypothetical protein